MPSAAGEALGKGHEEAVFFVPTQPAVGLNVKPLWGPTLSAPRSPPPESWLTVRLACIHGGTGHFPVGGARGETPFLLGAPHFAEEPT